MAETRNCRVCNRDFIHCTTCLTSWRTNVANSPPVEGHQCNPPPVSPSSEESNTGTAVAAGAAGGALAGTAGGAGVVAGAPAALGAAGFTSSGVAGGSIAASLQSLLYAGATPAGGWFATATSAGMGGAMGTAAVAGAALGAGLVVTAGTAYGIYKLVKNKGVKSSPEGGGRCPWCDEAGDGGGGGDGRGAGGAGGAGQTGKVKQGNKEEDVEFGKNQEEMNEKHVSMNVGDYLLRSEEEMMELAIKRSLEEAGQPLMEHCLLMERNESEEQMLERAVRLSLEDRGGGETLETDIPAVSEDLLPDFHTVRNEFECPVCLEIMRPPIHIWQCGEGHLLCGSCRDNPAVSCCPTCRGSWNQGGRNRGMERLAASLAS